jgi:hypothetical protein
MDAIARVPRGSTLADSLARDLSARNADSIPALLRRNTNCVLRGQGAA